MKGSVTLKLWFKQLWWWWSNLIDWTQQAYNSEGKQHLRRHEELQILYAQVHEDVQAARLGNMLSELPWILSTVYQVSAQSVY